MWTAGASTECLGEDGGEGVRRRGLTRAAVCLAAQLAHVESQLSATPVRFSGVRSLKHACLHAVLRQNADRGLLLATIREHSRYAGGQHSVQPDPGGSAYGMPRWIEGRLEAPRVIRVVPRPQSQLHHAPSPAPQQPPRLIEEEQVEGKEQRQAQQQQQQQPDEGEGKEESGPP